MLTGLAGAVVVVLAMLEPDGMGIHAARLAFGYLKLARKLGARVHTASPVIGYSQRNGVHYLATPGGTVRARNVAFATAGYTSPGLHPMTKHRLMPVLSNSVVTRPLSDSERAELVQRSPLKGRYDQPIDRESAYEVLANKAGAKPEVQGQATAQQESSSGVGGMAGAEAGIALVPLFMLLAFLGLSLVAGVFKRVR